MPLTLLFFTIKKWRGGDGREKMVHRYNVYVQNTGVVTSRTEKEVENIVLQTSVFLFLMKTYYALIFSRNVYTLFSNLIITHFWFALNLYSLST